MQKCPKKKPPKYNKHYNNVTKVQCQLYHKSSIHVLPTSYIVEAIILWCLGFLLWISVLTKQNHDSWLSVTILTTDALSQYFLWQHLLQDSQARVSGCTVHVSHDFRDFHVFLAVHVIFLFSWLTWSGLPFIIRYIVSICNLWYIWLRYHVRSLVHKAYLFGVLIQ